MKLKTFLTLVLLPLAFLGCCRKGVVRIADEVRIATDNTYGSVFILRLENLTSNHILYDRNDIAFAFRYGTFRSMMDGKMLDVEFLDSDSITCYDSQICGIDAGSFTNCAVGAAIHIKDVFPGDRVYWSVDYPMEVSISGVVQTNYLVGCGTCSVLTRRESIVEFCKINALPSEYVDTIMKHSQRY